MESRKITVIETKNQKKSVIMSAATTLEELKADLRNHNIDYTDMAFYEGTSKTEIKIDSSILPHDVPYKGKVTNELVFMLTNTKKKIKSGYSIPKRAEAYKIIRARGLQEECLKRFGKSFTNCKTSELLSLIQDDPEPKKNKVTKTLDSSKDNHNTTNSCDNVVNKPLDILITILEKKGILEPHEVSKITNILGESDNTEVSSSPYSDGEIEEMLSELNID